VGKDFQKKSLYSYLSAIPHEILQKNEEKIKALSEAVVNHQVDVLGSGWVNLSHGMQRLGVEGYRYNPGPVVRVDMEGAWLESRINRTNLAEARRVWGMVNDGYSPVDWQVDIKSGYRWKESIWYRDIKIGHKSGVDVKVPWEVSRGHNFIQLAWAFALAGIGREGFHPPEIYLSEFQNQTLDFISTNPPRYGVNWNCTMDVAIRVANWLMTYDVFRACGARFDEGYEQVFLRSIYEHGLHTVTNLEWDDRFRGNHYLANIVGLLFAAAYLPCTKETDAWLAFAVQELVKEVQFQFNPDGSNFEASTCYHRLASEMVVYATALVCALPLDKQRALKKYGQIVDKKLARLKAEPVEFYYEPGARMKTPFPEWYFKRLEKMAEFTIAVTKPSRCVHQVGDNDSGRFLKMNPAVRKMTVGEARRNYGNLKDYGVDLADDKPHWDENHLDHRHLVAAINGFFGRRDFATFVGGKYLEEGIIRKLAGGVLFESYRQRISADPPDDVSVGTEEIFRRLLVRLDGVKNSSKRRLEIPLKEPGMLEKAQRIAYPDFGLYILRSSRLYFAVRCGPIGHNGLGVHAHNDQLSIELNIDGKDMIADPGTYLYTPLFWRRNEYRSVKAHFTARVEGQEPGRLDLGLFELGNEAEAKCLYFGRQGFAGVHYGFHNPLWLVVLLTDDRIRISCVMEGDLSLILPEIAEGGYADSPPFSPSYGAQYEC
jgi:hypothetical protein